MKLRFFFFPLSIQLVGYLDEVVDMRFAGENEQFLVVANNSEQVKAFHRPSSSSQLLTGHGGVVLSLDVSSDGRTLLTGSKDNTVRMWRLDAASGKFSCIAVGTGHTHVVGAVAVSRYAIIIRCGNLYASAFRNLPSI